MNDQTTLTNPSRRRLAKGGLAVPVVLASLTSKNAFAALPYHCFVSGQLSNNQSAFGPNQQTANQSCTLPLNNARVQSALQNDRTTFSSVFGIKIYVRTNNTLTTSAIDSNNNPLPEATLLQVLKLTNATFSGNNPVPNLVPLKQAVVLYKNALVYPPPNDLVPLTTAQIIGLAQARYNNGSYTVKTSIGDKTYTSAQIDTYFNQLAA